MRLGYLVPEFPSQTHAFFWRELSALRDSGVQIEIISTRRPRAICRHEFAQAAAQQTHYLTPPGVRAIASVTTVALGRTILAMRYAGALRESSFAGKARVAAMSVPAKQLAQLCRRHRLDHVHIHSCANSAFLGALMRRYGGPSYSLTLHGDLDVYGKDHIEKMADAAFVSTVTRALQRQLIERVGLPECRAPVIMMGVDVERFKPTDRIGVAGKLNVASVARIEYCKGLTFAIQAVRKAVDAGVDIHYRIAGSGAYESEIRQHAMQLGLAGHVELLGSISEHEVRSLLAQSDVFALPSIGLGEAAPVAVMEAMATGLPVVSSIIGGTPDMITNEVDGFLVAQEDADALAARFIDLAKEPALRAKIGDAARRRAAQAFCHRANAQKLLAAIESAVRKSALEACSA
jgi:glycosyltransferase involved in cell wall biosynthesis